MGKSTGKTRSGACSLPIQVPLHRIIPDQNMRVEHPTSPWTIVLPKENTERRCIIDMFKHNTAVDKLWKAKQVWKWWNCWQVSWLGAGNYLCMHWKCLCERYAACHVYDALCNNLLVSLCQTTCWLPAKAEVVLSWTGWSSAVEQTSCKAIVFCVTWEWCVANTLSLFGALREC